MFSSGELYQDAWGRIWPFLLICVGIVGLIFCLVATNIHMLGRIEALEKAAQQYSSCTI